MGWASRQREASERLETQRYTVQRWTAFEWQETKEEKRKDREEHLERIAKILQRRLIDRFPTDDPDVRVVRVDKVPQLRFQLVVMGCDVDDARRRTVLRFERALAIKVPTGRGRKQVFSRYINRGRGGMVSVPDAVRLNPPWGKLEVTSPATSKRKTAEAA